MVPGAWAGDVDDNAAPWMNPPKSGGAPMTQYDFEATRECGRHPPAPAADLWPADGIDPAVDRVKATGRDSVVDRAPRVAKFQQLEESDDSMLGAGKAPRPPSPLWRT
jgi:hypothetical protein